MLGQNQDASFKRWTANQRATLVWKVVGTLGTTQYVYESDSGPVHKEVHLFLLEWIPGEPLPLDGEMERVDWCSLDEAEQRLTFETERRAIGWARAELAERARAHSGMDG